MDFVCTLSNTETVEIETKSLSWESFTRQFIQTAAYVPGFATEDNLEASEEEKKEATETSMRETSNIIHRPQHKTFCGRISTEEYHRSEDARFYGAFSHIRETLDYSYHGHYTHRRQLLQDSIIEDFLDGVVIKDKDGKVYTTPTEPWIVFTAGAMVSSELQQFRSAGDTRLMCSILHTGSWQELYYEQTSREGKVSTDGFRPCGSG